MYSLEHLRLTEKFNFGWELNHMPLAFQASALTTRPLRQLFQSLSFIQRTYRPKALTLTTTVAMFLLLNLSLSKDPFKLLNIFSRCLVDNKLNLFSETSLVD